MIKFVPGLLYVAVILSGCNSKDVINPREAKAEVTSPEDRNRSDSVVAPLDAQFALLQHKLEQGYYEEVAAGADEAYRATEKSAPIWAWKFRLLQARATMRTLQSSAALDLLKIEPPPGLPIEEFARKEIVSAEALCSLGKHQEGIAALNRAKPLLPAASVNPVLNAEWLLFRGKCDPLPFTSEAARNSFEQARRLAHGRDKYIEALAEGNLAFRLSQLQRFDESIDHSKEVLALAKGMGSPLLEELTLGYLGQNYYELGEYQKAEQYARGSEKIAEDLGRIDHQARHLIDMGSDEMCQSRYVEAEEDFLKAISLARKNYDKKDAGAKAISDDIIARSLNHLTWIELSRQALDRAEDYSRQAATLKMGDDELLNWKLFRIDLALARKEFPVAQALLTQLVSAKPQDFQQLWQAQVRLARMYELKGEVASAEKYYRMAIAAAVGASAKLNDREYKASLLGNLPIYDICIEFLVRINQPLEALQVAEIGRARALAKELPSNLPIQDTAAWLANIQSGLKRSGKMALAYWEGVNELYIWLVTADQVKFLHQADAVPQLKRLAASYQKEIQLHEKIDESPAAAKLYELVVQPVESLIPKGASVVIVAHGSLYDINFESLVVPGAAPHYWIEDVRLENAISLNQAVKSAGPIPHYKKEMLAVGAPIQVSEEFPALLYAPEEIEGVTKPFPPSRRQIFRAEQATPHAFVAGNPEDYRYIHFVAHGTNVPLEPLESAIILSRDDDNSYKLYARDIANLKHPIQAELVTISSCKSGASTSDIGWPMGLSWAFLHAGARHVIAALWEVDDAATPQLMEQFYAELAKGKNAGEALRDAKLGMLHASGRHKIPFYWASLQLYAGS
jgi:CHAT domain-containing protein